MLDLGPQMLDPLDPVPVLVVPGLQRPEAPIYSGDLLLDFFDLLLRPRVAVHILAQAPELNLELEPAALQAVDLFRLGVELHAHHRTRFVHQVDGLVWEKARGDVPIRKLTRNNQSSVVDSHAVMCLIPLLQAAEDRDGVRDGRFFDLNHLKPSLQRSILLDVLPILVQGSGAYTPKQAPGERRLEQVCSVHAPFGSPCPDQQVELIDEENNLPVRVLHLLEHAFQPLLELALVLGAGNQGAHIQTENLALFQRLRYVASQNPLGQTLNYCSLTHSRLADETGVVLGPPRQHLHQPAYLLLSPDHRVQPPCASLGYKVFAVLG
mmetsp:Transcript_2589/g.6071  ORF Transcript_2589/g.6071 Transcript_2589/m.6071 type:complete len:323 (-) Transcript_2589:776-1744(-)